MNDLVFRPAAELARLVARREISAVELTRAFVERIEEVNPKVNAIVTFLPEQALAQARAFDDSRAAHTGAIAGLPIAYKDLVPTRGIRTTYGSRIFADHVPQEDHILVERTRAAGAIVLGKTNTPEFGAGSQTFNAVFGVTRNPYDLTKTAGGSSGGAAAAVASGMLPFADGTDFGASLRNPGSFCNVVGFRPTPGRVPAHPAADLWFTLTVAGPIARNVRDAALLLSVMAGPDVRSPISIAEPGARFALPLERDFKGVRVAWSRNLGGLPVDPRVTVVLEARRSAFESLGCIVEEAEPDLSGAQEAFYVLRWVSSAQRYGAHLQGHRELVKDTVAWDIERGLALTGAEVGRAMAARSQVYDRMRRFMERYEFLLLPVAQVPPFDAGTEYPQAIAGVKMNDYLDWLRSCYYITMTSHPAISVPAGFTGDPAPLPVGLQIVGRYRDDFGVLQLAHAFEQVTGAASARPPG